MHAATAENLYNGSANETGLNAHWRLNLKFTGLVDSFPPRVLQPDDEDVGNEPIARRLVGRLSAILKIVGRNSRNVAPINCSAAAAARVVVYLETRVRYESSASARVLPRSAVGRLNEKNPPPMLERDATHGHSVTVISRPT